MESISKAELRLPDGTYASINPANLILNARENPRSEKNYLESLSSEQLNALMIAIENNGNSGISQDELNSSRLIGNIAEQVFGYDPQNLSPDQEKQIQGIIGQLQTSANDIFTKKISPAPEISSPNVNTEWVANAKNTEIPPTNPNKIDEALRKAGLDDSEINKFKERTDLDTLPNDSLLIKMKKC